LHKISLQSKSLYDKKKFLKKKRRRRRRRRREKERNKKRGRMVVAHGTHSATGRDPRFC
jgi:hypothetical protein